MMIMGGCDGFFFFCFSGCNHRSYEWSVCVCGKQTDLDMEVFYKILFGCFWSDKTTWMNSKFKFFISFCFGLKVMNMIFLLAIWQQNNNHQDYNNILDEQNKCQNFAKKKSNRTAIHTQKMIMMWILLFADCRG